MNIKDTFLLGTCYNQTVYVILTYMKQRIIVWEALDLQ